MPTQLVTLCHSIVTMMALINFGVSLQAVNSNMTPITSCRNVISITETHGLCVCCLSCFFCASFAVYRNEEFYTV